MTTIAHVPQTGVAVQNEPHDLAALSDAEFNRALERIDTRKKRMQRILEHSLVEDAHYGNPKDRAGKGVFKRPVLYRAGADEMLVAFGLEVVTDNQLPDNIIETQEYVSVTVRRVITDRMGRVLDRTTASCTTKEKRFKKTSGEGFLYTDAREALNDCVAMAEKRAKVRLVVGALGMGAFLTAGDEMDAAMVEDERPLTPWTGEEKRKVYAAAQAKGLGKSKFAALVLSTLGRPQVGTGEDVTKLLAAIAAYVPKEEDETTEAPAPTERPANVGESGEDLEYEMSLGDARKKAGSDALAAG